MDSWNSPSNQKFAFGGDQVCFVHRNSRSVTVYPELREITEMDSSQPRPRRVVPPSMEGKLFEMLLRACKGQSKSRDDLNSLYDMVLRYVDLEVAVDNHREFGRKLHATIRSVVRAMGHLSFQEQEQLLRHDDDGNDCTNTVARLLAMTQDRREKNNKMFQDITALHHSIKQSVVDNDLSWSDALLLQEQASSKGGAMEGGGLQPYAEAAMTMGTEKKWVQVRILF